jgi:hypothetical protein
MSLLAKIIKRLKRLWRKPLPPLHMVGYESFRKDLIQSWREGRMTADEVLRALEMIRSQRETVWKDFLERCALMDLKEAGEQPQAD